MPFSLAKLTSQGDETMLRRPAQRHVETQWDAVDQSVTATNFAGPVANDAQMVNF